MARRKYFEQEKIDPEVTQSPTIDMNVVEIRGSGKKWRVAIPDESNYVTHVPVFKDGVAKGSVGSFIATNKLIEIHDTFATVEEAQAAAEFIKPGCEIKVVKPSRGGRKKKKGTSG